MSNSVTDTDSNELVAVSTTQFDIKKFVYKLIGFLPWIIISGIIAYSGAKLYLRYTPQLHRVSANLLIKDNEESSPENTVLKELGVMPGGKEVQNQIDILESYELAEDIVDSLNLQFTLYTQGRIASSIIYGNNAPVFIHLIKNDTIPLKPSSFLLFMDKDKFTLKQGEHSAGYRYNDTFLLGGRQVYFVRNWGVKIDDNGYSLIIQPKRSVAVSLSSAITVTKLHEMGGILEIAMLDQSPDRAIDIINKLIEAFNTAGINDKNIVGKKTSHFLADRVDTVSKELDELEMRAEAFKRDNKITDISSQGNKYIDQVFTYDNEHIEQLGQLKLLETLEQFIRGLNSFTEIIPLQSELSEPTLGKLVDQYNEGVLSYQEQIKISTQKDPVTGRLKSQLTDIKEHILKTIQSIKEENLLVNESDNNEL
ncbi:MAG: hypothetical protein ABI921_06815, partial [Panacibacter sp.]